MAVVRCVQCMSVSREGYRIHAEPIGYPEAGVICGMPGCERPGLVWMRGREAMEYVQGSKTCFPLTAGKRPAKILVKLSE